jgi:TolB-like protein/tetratricopeptide (TPR) repeat protein
VRIDNLFSELKRRNVYKVAVTYAVVGWLVIQVCSTVLPTFHAPEWVLQTIVALAILGFPFALFIAWAFEVTPEGVKRTEAADAKRQHRPGGMWIAIVLVAAAMSIALFFVGRQTARHAESQATATVAQKSIAVLPLVNTSGDPSNEYFSDGLSEELIAVLAKIPDLKVIGRSSSFLFKGKSADSNAIGRKLGVAHLIEGSVRKQGKRVRIVAELITAADGRSIWSETYDREVKDVFAVQNEIATAVADQMKVKLLGQSTQRDAASSTENPEAHNAVLQAEFYFQQQTADSIRKSISFLQEAVRLDPNYALAYAKLSQSWRQYAASFAIQETEQAYEEARQAANKAVSLAPDLLEVRMNEGLLAMNPVLDFVSAEKEFRRILQSFPNNAAAKNALTLSLIAQGRLAEAEETCKQAISLDPLLTSLWFNFGRVKMGMNRYAEAEEAFRKGLELQPAASRFHTFLATLDLLQNRSEQATANAAQETEGFWRDYAVALVQQAQGDRAVADAALKDFITKDSIGAAFQVAVLYAIRKDADQMFKWLETAYQTHDSGMVQLAITPFLIPYRSDPRFIGLCQRLNVQLPAAPAKP